jgi:FKBP-type peptidyl-prolyl cis-trans isomerase
MRGITILFLVLGAVACRRSSEDNPSASAVESGGGSGKSRTQQITPPVDVKLPPPDAIKTASGLIYKRLVSNDAGPQPKRNDTVLVNYTGWRQATGETFFTNRGRNAAMPLRLPQAAPGFIEAMQLLHKGDQAMLWMPASIGYKAPPTQGTPEALVYEVEVVDIEVAPAVPQDVGKPPESAAVLPSGAKLVVVKPGTSKDKIRQFDTVAYHYTAWDAEGRMLDSTEPKQRPESNQPSKLPVAMTEALTQMAVGARVRFWIDAEKMKQGGKPLPGDPAGVVCYELEVTQVTRPAHEPPPTPPDVARPPAGAAKTAKGVFYRVLKAAGKATRHPVATDTVKVHYTGWTTDGRMFDSSQLRGEPASFSLGGVIAGWTDGIPVMTVGDRVRLWIPEELAYKGAPGKPAGMLVFDVELLEIMAPAAHPTDH